MRINRFSSLLAVLSFLFVAKSFAVEPLSLSCGISLSAYAGVASESHFFDVVLSHHKHKEGGHKLVLERQGLQFWVMAHSVQTLSGVEFINSYQLAVKDSVSGLFVHVLSDISNTPLVAPQSARLSLVDYHPDTFLEKGELMFDCKSAL